jgi:spectrin beta
MNRKHEWESTTKKASHRSWEKGLFVVLKKSSVTVFKDQKHYIQEPGKTYRGEPPADLKGAVAAVPPDYTKRKNVFRLKLANGAEFLFEAKSVVCLSLQISSFKY